MFASRQGLDVKLSEFHSFFCNNIASKRLSLRTLCMACVCKLTRNTGPSNFSQIANMLTFIFKVKRLQFRYFYKCSKTVGCRTIHFDTHVQVDRVAKLKPAYQRSWPSFSGQTILFFVCFHWIQPWRWNSVSPNSLALLFTLLCARQWKI